MLDKKFKFPKKQQEQKDKFSIKKLLNLVMAGAIAAGMFVSKAGADEVERVPSPTKIAKKAEQASNFFENNKKQIERLRLLVESPRTLSAEDQQFIQEFLPKLDRVILSIKLSNQGQDNNLILLKGASSSSIAVDDATGVMQRVLHGVKFYVDATGKGSAAQSMESHEQATTSNQERVEEMPDVVTTSPSNQELSITPEMQEVLDDVSMKSVREAWEEVVKRLRESSAPPVETPPELIRADHAKKTAPSEVSKKTTPRITTPESPQIKSQPTTTYTPPAYIPKPTTQPSTIEQDTQSSQPTQPQGLEKIPPQEQATSKLAQEQNSTEVPQEQASQGDQTPQEPGTQDIQTETPQEPIVQKAQEDSTSQSPETAEQQAEVQEQPVTESEEVASTPESQIEAETPSQESLESQVSPELQKSPTEIFANLDSTQQDYLSILSQFLDQEELSEQDRVALTAAKIMLMYQDVQGMDYYHLRTQLQEKFTEPEADSSDTKFYRQTDYDPEDLINFIKLLQAGGSNEDEVSQNELIQLQLLLNFPKDGISTQFYIKYTLIRVVIEMAESNPASINALIETIQKVSASSPEIAKRVSDHDLIKMLEKQKNRALVKLAFKQFTSQENLTDEEINKISELCDLISPHDVPMQELAYDLFNSHHYESVKHIKKLAILSVLDQHYNWGRVPAEYQANKEFVLELVGLEGGLLMHIKEFQGDLDVARVAVGNNRGAIRYVREDLVYNNMDLLLIRMQVSGQHNAKRFFSKASPELQESQELCLKLVQYNGLFLELFPQYANSPEVVLTSVSQNGYALKYADPYYQNDPATALLAIQENSSAIELVSGNLRGQYDFLVQAVAIDEATVAHADLEPSIIIRLIEAVHASGDVDYTKRYNMLKSLYSLRDIKPVLSLFTQDQLQEFFDYIIKQLESDPSWVKKNLVSSRNLLTHIMRINGTLFSQLPDEFKSENGFIMPALSNSSEVLDMLPEKVQEKLNTDEAYLLWAISMNADAINYSTLIGRDGQGFIIKALKKNPEIITKIKQSNLSNKYILSLYINANPDILPYLPQEVFENPETLNALIQSQPQAFSFLSTEKKSDPVFVISILKDNPQVLPYIDDSLKNNVNFILEAEEANFAVSYIAWDALKNSNREYVKLKLAETAILFRYSEAFQDDEEIARIAIHQYPPAFEHASERLRDSEDIVRLAVTENRRHIGTGSMLSFASERLRNDVEFVQSMALEAAMGTESSVHSWSAFENIPDTVLDTPEFVRFVEENIYRNINLFTAWKKVGKTPTPEMRQAFKKMEQAFATLEIYGQIKAGDLMQSGIEYFSGSHENMKRAENFYKFLKHRGYIDENYRVTDAFAPMEEQFSFGNTSMTTQDQQAADIIRSRTSTYTRFNNSREIIRNRYQVSSEEIQEELIELLGEEYFASLENDSRAIALVVYPKHDSPGVFNPTQIDDLMKAYRVIYYDVDSEASLIKSVLEGTNHESATLVILAGHGGKEYITFGAAEHESSSLNLHDTNIKIALEGRVLDGGRVVLESCSTGKGREGGEGIDNIAEYIHDMWPNSYTFAATTDGSMIYQFNEAGELINVQGENIFRMTPSN